MKSIKTIWIIVSVVVVGAIIAAVVLTRPAIPYKLTADDALKEISNPANRLNAEQLANGTKEKYAFVDLRSPLDFDLWHYETAINIPAEKVMQEEYIESIKKLSEEQETIVLYAATPQQSAGVWLLLKQAGIEGIKYFAGTFSQLVSAPVVSDEAALMEIPVIDTAALKSIKQNAQGTASNQPQAAKNNIIPKRVQPASGGGC